MVTLVVEVASKLCSGVAGPSCWFLCPPWECADPESELQGPFQKLLSCSRMAAPGQAAVSTPHSPGPVNPAGDVSDLPLSLKCRDGN